MPQTIPLATCVTSSRRAWPALAALALVLGGCAEAPEDGTGADALSVSIEAPAALARMADRNRSVPRLRVDGREITVRAEENDGMTSYAVTRRFESGSSITIILEWLIDGRPVWGVERTISVDGELVVRFPADVYTTADFDEDADGHSNFDELEANSDPSDPLSTPGTAPTTPPVTASFDDFVGEWLGLYVYDENLQFTTGTRGSFRDSEALLEALNENVLGAADGIVVDSYVLRIEPSGVFTTFDAQDDEYAQSNPDVEVESCVDRQTGTIEAVSATTFVFGPSNVLLHSSNYVDDPVVVERRPADPNVGDSLWISTDREFWAILEPYTGPPLASFPDC